LGVCCCEPATWSTGVGTSIDEIGAECEARISSTFDDEGVLVVPGLYEVVDEVDVIRAIIGDFARFPEAEIEGIVVAGVIDDPDVGDDETFDASSAIAIDNIVCD